MLVEGKPGEFGRLYVTWRRKSVSKLSKKK